MDCSMPGFPVHHHLLELVQTRVHWVGHSIQPSHPLGSLLLLPLIFPSIRVFSNESVLCIRWPNYWCFSFSISPSNEYSGLISFRTDWFDLLAVRETFGSLLQHRSSEGSVLCIRWPKHWSFSFSINPSNEYSGPISFRMDWLDLLGVQGTLKSLLQHHSSKASILRHSAFLWLLEKP